MVIKKSSKDVPKQQQQQIHLLDNALRDAYDPDRQEMRQGSALLLEKGPSKKAKHRLENSTLA